MKALFYCANPFFLMHGGTQTLLEALMREIAALGVEVEPARWWDDRQRGDILHFMNRPTRTLVDAARQKGFKTVMTETLDATSSRPTWQLWTRRFAFGCDRLLGGAVSRRLGVEVYRMLDALVYLVELERQVACGLYRARAERTHVIPLGVEADALEELGRPEPEGDYLICTGTIIPRKNNVLLAQTAKVAQVPIVFLGKPFNQSDPYFLQFQSLVDGRFVRYPGFVSREEKHRLLRGARGFALLSRFESGCIALQEAAAARLPLFLPQLPWAAKVYQHARQKAFVPLTSEMKLAPALRRFYDTAHRLRGQTVPVLNWRQTAQEYVRVYEDILRKQ
jgi:glycosyltransferase involved in cell wall biosynthesis